MNSQPRLTALDYLAEVAKDWAINRFATAQNGEFSLAPVRFDLDGLSVRRHELVRDSREAADPITFAKDRREASAWARSDTVVLVADCEDGESVTYNQEIVEVIGLEGDDVLVEAAMVVRVQGFPPCLGSFWAVL